MDDLLKRLTLLRDDAVKFAEAHSELALLNDEQRRSAVNLLHYFSLRQNELRGLQVDLIKLGLTSLGILEGHTLATLNHVIAILERLLARELSPAPEPPVTVEDSARLLEQRSERLFGPAPAERDCRIMVTMPSEAADDGAFVQRLLTAGMDVMRINCAHDGPEAWLAMIAHLRAAERTLGRTCKIQIDLAGPKLRTGTIEALGRVHKMRPLRNSIGRVVQSARVWLVPFGHGAVASTYPTLEVKGDAMRRIEVGDRLHFRDARAAKRSWAVVDTQGEARLIESDKTCYAQDGAQLRIERGRKHVGDIVLVNVRETISPIPLAAGDHLVLTRAPLPGSEGVRDPSGVQVKPARIHCTLPEAFTYVRPGESVWFDDGKIGGRVEQASDAEIRVRISHVPPTGAKLRSEKGINFPDTALATEALTAKDRDDLRVLVAQVDMVALSFVRTPRDVEALQRYLEAMQQGEKGIVLKIENRSAFEHLPAILLTALRSNAVGVMVARGDLAVEVGFERLSEIQEEILWLCEAAHVPVIWATQILEGLVKSGAPSRAEVTDAASSIRAECAMLNKGPNIVGSVEFLDEVLRRMESHYHKRRLMMRPLNVCRTQLLDD
ncbi:MAG: pyruvate kinase [Thiotrichales bacterium]